MSPTEPFGMERDGLIVVLTPGGLRPKLAEAMAILSQLRRLIAIGEVDRVALDLSRVESPEDHLVIWMQQLDRLLSRHGGSGRLVACRPSPAMREFLKASGLDRLF